jgi:hypothetical protein
VKDRSRIERPRYRKSAVALMVAAAACSGHDATGGTDLSPNVFVNVSMTGDGDGRVDVSSGTAWSCTIAVGQVTHVGTDVTHAANHCDWETYDAGGGGSIAFHAVPGSGSVFGGWSNDCTGADADCTVEWLGDGGRTVSVGAQFLFPPSGVTVEVANHGLLQGMTTQATAEYTSGRTLQNVLYEWMSSDPSVASVSGTGSQATVTAVSAGTTLISASTRGVPSNEVTVNVGELQTGLGVLEGVLYDVDGTTPVDSIYLVAGPVAGSSATTVLRTFTGRQDGSGVVIPPGGYRLDAEPGRYAVFSVGVVGKRYMNTRGDSANVFANQTDTLNLFASRADYLDMRNTDLGTQQASEGAMITLTGIEFQAWSYVSCPLCGISLGIGVDSTALAVHVFDQVAGTYPGRSETVSIPITVPDHGGTIYATLITTSTSEANKEPGLQQYRDRWTANVQGTTMIPIGTLVVN